MNIVRQHTIFKGLTLILVVAFLLPTAVKVIHVFEKHHHEVCLGESDTHFHTLVVDCQFYKFKINIPFTIPENSVVVIEFPKINCVIPTHYSFLSEYQNLQFSLRGPPTINLI
ncbi:hypothetical protein LX77_00046 [Gelidibacter algens]|jgi:hypothetical protein|uniref:Uncharacterized protein n=1 Tax=Gelidibacter algens TaxID=49280 RepID=A0A1A7QWY3_9FLAO|nr:hypothetical protein [Gelidibacter algens]OBX23793.1 hypothetical protein A9996_15655 [Gelidibacter algens]RAJ27474.1 hypothetical protein LX77_00046 [Gelidibacter algens]